MRRCLVAIALLIVPPIAQARVMMMPEEGKAGVGQTYGLGVPTDGQVNTTSVELEVPAGVIVTSVQGMAETKRDGGGRIASITVENGHSAGLRNHLYVPSHQPDRHWSAGLEGSPTLCRRDDHGLG
jgi:hypothetical protein